MKTDSLKAFLESLDLRDPVTTDPGRILAGPPPWVVDAALFFGVGRWFDTPAARQILGNLGIDERDSSSVLRSLRSRAEWTPRWLALADERAELAQSAEARGDRDLALREYQAALALRRTSTSGDGYYFFTPIPARLPILEASRRLRWRLYELAGERVERLSILHSRGVTPGLLHLPPGGASRSPALVVLHGLGGNKEGMDEATGAFREAGYATLSIDLPAHGEAAEGPRLWPEAEEVVLAALEGLASRPEVEPDRIGLLGGSLGGYYALRAAAASRLPKVCLEFASPFDIGARLPESVRGLQVNMAWALGARSLSECFEMARPLRLNGVIEKIACPVFIGHGTRDHFVSFTSAYEIARRLRAPVAVQPFVGADHEVAIPRAPAFSAPAVAWLHDQL